MIRPDLPPDHWPADPAPWDYPSVDLRPADRPPVDLLLAMDLPPVELASGRGAIRTADVVAAASPSNAPVSRGAAPSEAAYALAAAVLGLLERGSATLATCESLTGGLLGATLTSVPGASAVFRGGLITYATDLKHTLARVDPGELARDGAVAPSTALAMAAGAREVCAADWGVAVTGVAGPDPQEGHPAGTVFIAVADGSGAAVRQYRLDGDRHTIRTRTVEAALRQLTEAYRGR